MATLDLTQRAQPHDLPEQMDQPCSYLQAQGCLRDIERVNRLTFAYRPTLSWTRELIAATPRSTRPLHLVDVGCGSGGLLRKLSAWASRHHIPVTLTGIDLNPDAIRAATEATAAGQPIRWIHGDVYSFEPEGGVDVVVSSLLAHHLEEAELLRFLRWMEQTARLGWFVNDLHRKPLPYRLFGLLTRVLPLHPFVQHDGLVSIRRSFLLEDWQRLCASACLPMADLVIRAYRPARLCVGHIKR